MIENRVDLEKLHLPRNIWKVWNRRPREWFHQKSAGRFPSDCFITKLKDHILFGLSEAFNSLYFQKNPLCFHSRYFHFFVIFVVWFLLFSLPHWLLSFHLLDRFLPYSFMKFWSPSQLCLRHSSLVTLYFLLGLSYQYTWFRYMHIP